MSPSVSGPEPALAPPNVVLFGPPGVGKTAVGRALARRLGRPFVDTDAEVEARAGMPIPELFAAQGEAAFRRLEAEVCREVAAQSGLVVAVGGGALVDEENRRRLEASGVVVCLRARPEALAARLGGDGGRPLLAGGDPTARLTALLETRAPVYDSFPHQVETEGRSVEAVAEAIAAALPAWERRCFRVRQGEGYEVWVGRGLLGEVRERLEAVGLTPPFVVVGDETVGRLYGRAVAEALAAPLVVFPPGEASKTLETVARLYDAVLEAGLERGGTLVALGGGVVGDVAGFVAATVLRGVRWAALPTTLLAMADASVGGKVGVDLPRGKNLVGAFHPPALVLADPATLDTLPPEAVRDGLAEVLKAALIGDPDLLAWMAAEGARPAQRWLERALAVKIAVVEADPLEQGEREKLNLGHTVAHALEAATGYALRHGQAVAVGLLAEAHLSEALGLAEPGLAARVEAALAALGLPRRYRGPAPEQILAAMAADKKRRRGRLRFALPMAPGRVALGVQAAPEKVRQVLAAVWEGP